MRGCKGLNYPCVVGGGRSHANKVDSSDEL